MVGTDPDISDRKQAEKEIFEERMLELAWICKCARYTEAEAMAFINSGELGYKTVKSKKVPITVSPITYWRYRGKLNDPAYQVDEIFKIIRDEYAYHILKYWKLVLRLEAEQEKNLVLAGQDTAKRQFIINSMFRNMPYATNFLDLLKRIMEKHKMPFPENAEVKKIIAKRESHVQKD